MKYLLIFCTVFALTHSLNAQEFEIVGDTLTKNCYVGQKVEFELSIVATNDFNSTVILRTDVTDQNVSFSDNYINPPYKKFKLIVDTKAYYEGFKTIKVTGVSGVLKSEILCHLNISKNNMWAKVKLPNFSGRENKGFGFLFDKNKNITYTAIGSIEGLDGELILSSFVDGEWKHSALQTNIYYYDTFPIDIYGDSIWISCREGLVLAHNKNVYIYNDQNCDIGEGEVFYSFSDNFGNPFVVSEIDEFTNDYFLGISYFYNNKWHILDTNKYGIRAYRITNEYFDAYKKVVIDKENNIWFINKDNKLYKLYMENNEPLIEETNIEIEQNIYLHKRIYTDKEKTLWLINREKQEFQYIENDSVHIIKFPSSYDTVYRFVINNKNEFWFQTPQGLVHYFNKDYTFYGYKDIPSAHIPFSSPELKIDKHNNLWIRNYDEILVFNPNGLVEIPIATSIEDNQEQNTSLVFPNPASENISLDLGEHNAADFMIYDILGNEVMTVNDYISKSELDISIFPIGTYIIQIQTKNGVICKRLFVNR